MTIQCDKFFSRKKKKRKPYEYSLWGDTTSSQKSGYIAHLKIHSGECPYRCCICNRDFETSSSLEKHMYVDSLFSGKLLITNVVQIPLKHLIFIYICTRILILWDTGNLILWDSGKPNI